MEKAGSWDDAVAGSFDIRAATARVVKIESAWAKRQFFVMFLSDLDRFDGTIPLAAFMRAGRPLGFSFALFALEVQFCLAMRVVKVGVVCAEGVLQHCFVVVGSSGANNLAWVGPRRDSVEDLHP